MQVTPYLQFDGRCDEAIQFYKTALGAEVQMLMRFKESPDQSMIKPGVENKVMHASIRIGDSTINLSDGHCTGQGKFDGFSLSLTLKSDAEAKRAFDALGQGGKVGMPLTKTFFATSFGMVNDRFGVSWMVYVPQAM
ncbi:MAG TPA: VOC family protein [Tepidisphaeraceae bacterium]|nr:VOC family protein [Tepidisphaeraceae bacterium]